MTGAGGRPPASGLRLGGRHKPPLILQTEAAECGLACLAMVANISYLAARGVFDAIGIPQIRRRNPYATNFKQLRQALTEFGVDSTLERWRGWQHLW